MATGQFSEDFNTQIFSYDFDTHKFMFTLDTATESLTVGFYRFKFRAVNSVGNGYFS